MRSSSLMIRSFFSLPTSTTSTASNKSDWQTTFLPCFTALIAASFIIFAKSEPTAPEVASAIASKSTLSSIFTSLECTFSVSTRPFKSGLSTMMRLSNLPGRKSAGSKISGRLVAANKSNPLFVSKPSISASNWFSVCSRSSFPPSVVSRDLPMASISSIKTMHGAIRCASLNKSRTRDAPTPTYISTNAEPDNEKNGTLASPATAFASNVLPVPGGPTSRAPFGSLAPIPVYFSGLCKKSTTSCKDSFASSWPATSWNVTPVSFSTYIFALLLPNPITPPMPPLLAARRITTVNTIAMAINGRNMINVSKRIAGIVSGCFCSNSTPASWKRSNNLVSIMMAVA